MEEKSFESSSSISSRKTSNFFPKLAMSTPNLNTYSTPMTPIIPLASSGVNFNQLNQALNNLSNPINQPTPKSFGLGYGGSYSNGTYSSHTNQSNYSLASNPTTSWNGFGNGGSNQSTPIFNDFEFEVKSPEKRASSFNDIWKKPLDEYNFPLESTFESLEIGRELEKNYLDLNTNLSNTLNFVLEESDLAPDQLPDSSIYKKKRSYSSNHNYVYNGQNYSPGNNYSPEMFPVNYGSGSGSGSVGSVGSVPGNMSLSGSVTGSIGGPVMSGMAVSSVSGIGPVMSGMSGMSGPGSMSGSIHGSMSGSMPGSMSGSFHGSIPGSMSGSISGSVSGISALPNTLPNTERPTRISIDESFEPEEEIFIKLPKLKPLVQPTLTIQKFNESFSSTFYKRNKNGYMYIKELNDDLIKLDDYYFKIDLKLRKDRTTLTIDVNDIIGSEFINDFKIVKKKVVKKYE